MVLFHLTCMVVGAGLLSLAGPVAGQELSPTERVGAELGTETRTVGTRIEQVVPEPNARIDNVVRELIAQRH